MENTKSLSAIFEPNSVAVVGASRDPLKLGNLILKDMIKAQFKGSIYAVNPSTNEVLGLRTYASIKDVPKPLDLAVIAVPARFVFSVVDECAEAGCRALIIVSGGFREMGAAGAELQERLLERVKTAGMRMVGPNCMGVSNPHANFCASFPVVTVKGSISLIVNSGTVGNILQYWAEVEGVGISKYCDLGNHADVDEVDLIQYFGQDPHTKVIACGLEGISNGREFVRVASEVSKSKPIVILKSGRSKGGAATAATHSSSMAGRDEIISAAFEKAGIVRVDTQEELFDVSKALMMLKLPRGDRILVITSSGGEAILALDACENLGLEASQLSQRVIDVLKRRLPEYAVVRNPLDLTTACFDAEVYADSIRVTEEEPYDVVLGIFEDPIPNVALAMGKVAKETNKVIAAVYIEGPELEKSEMLKLHSVGVPVFPTPERAMKAIKGLCQYASWRRRHT